MSTCSNVRNNTTQVIQNSGNSVQVPDIFLILVALIGILLNGVLLVVGRKNVPKSCLIFICNLAVADLATAVVALLLGFKTLIGSKVFHRIFAIASWCTVLASFLTLLGIAVQRYISVVYSMWSHSRMKNLEWFYKLIIVVIWLLALTLAPFLHYFKLVTLLIMTTFEELMIIVIIVLYLNIYWSFRSYRLKDKEGLFAKDKERLRLNLKKEAKLSVVVCCVTAMLVIGVLPNVITVQAMTTMVLSRDVKNLHCTKILNDFHSYLMFIEVLGFGLNSIIYFWHNRIRNMTSNANWLVRVRRAIGMTKAKGRIVPEITIMQSRTTEMAHSVCSAERETIAMRSNEINGCS